MKTQIFLIVISTLMTGALFTSCETASQKEENAQSEVVQDTQDVINETNQNAAFIAQREEIAEEWRVFKADMEEQIAKNDKRIAELRDKLEKTGNNLDKAYVKRVEALEQKNRDLRTRISTFDSSQTNWQSFKSEFNKDLDDLGQALKDFTVDNKK